MPICPKCKQNSTSTSYCTNCGIVFGAFGNPGARQVGGGGGWTNLLDKFISSPVNVFMFILLALLLIASWMLGIRNPFFYFGILIAIGINIFWGGPWAKLWTLGVIVFFGVQVVLGGAYGTLILPNQIGFLTSLTKTYVTVSDGLDNAWCNIKYGFTNPELCEKKEISPFEDVFSSTITTPLLAKAGMTLVSDVSLKLLKRDFEVDGVKVSVTKIWNETQDFLDAEEIPIDRRVTYSYTNDECGPQKTCILRKDDPEKTFQIWFDIPCGLKKKNQNEGQIFIFYEVESHYDSIEMPGRVIAVSKEKSVTPRQIEKKVVGPLSVSFRPGRDSYVLKNMPQRIADVTIVLTNNGDATAVLGVTKGEKIPADTIVIKQFHDAGIDDVIFLDCGRGFEVRPVTKGEVELIARNRTIIKMQEEITIGCKIQLPEPKGDYSFITFTPTVSYQYKKQYQSSPIVKFDSC